MIWLANNWRRAAIAVLVLLSVGYGEIRYRNGWYAHSDKVNVDYAQKKQNADAALVPTEQKAAKARDGGKVIYRTITRDVVKYVQSPARTMCKFDSDAIRLRQQAIDAANHIPGFDDPAVQGK